MWLFIRKNKAIFVFIIIVVVVVGALLIKALSLPKNLHYTNTDKDLYVVVTKDFISYNDKDVKTSPEIAEFLYSEYKDTMTVHLINNKADASLYRDVKAMLNELEVKLVEENPK